MKASLISNRSTIRYFFLKSSEETRIELNREFIVEKGLTENIFLRLLSLPKSLHSNERCTPIY